MLEGVAIVASSARVMTVPCEMSWLCAVMIDDLSSASNHTSSSSLSSESTARIEVSSPRGVVLCSVSFLLYFALNFLYIYRPFMHEIIIPTLPIIMSHGIIECAI
jgi:hypothetical protein